MSRKRASIRERKKLGEERSMILKIVKIEEEIREVGIFYLKIDLDPVQNRRVMRVKYKILSNDAIDFLTISDSVSGKFKTFVKDENQAVFLCYSINEVYKRMQEIYEKCHNVKFGVFVSHQDYDRLVKGGN